MPKHARAHYDIAVIGGGNAALCAALTAAASGAKVLILETAPQPYRGGNSRQLRLTPPPLRLAEEVPGSGDS